MSRSTVFWLAVIVAATVPIVCGYINGVRSAPPMIFDRVKHVASVSDMPANVILLRDEQPGSDAAGDDFSRDDVVVDRAPRTASDDIQAERVAIAIGLCGRSLPLEAGFAQLPIPLAIVVDPAGPAARDIAALARQNGKRVFVQIEAAPSAAALAAMRARLGPFDGVASRSATGIASVLSGTGLAFFDERGDADATLFARASVPLVRRDLTVDDRGTGAYISFMLDQALALAQRRGTAVAFARPQSATLHALRRFVQAHGRDAVVFGS